MRLVLIAILIVLFLVLASFLLIRKSSNQKNEIQTPSPTPNSIQVIDEVQNLLAKKYSKSTAEVKITLTKQDGNFASGSVLFGQGGPGEGGVWLARLSNNVWEVVFDGNGSIDCKKMRQQFNFPDTILKPNFCD